jgi:SM-20-related protein
MDSNLGVSIRDHFLDLNTVRGLIETLRVRRARGEFAAARVGGGTSALRRADIRGDLTCWIDAPLFPAERILLERLEHLRLELNREAYLGLFDLELHYAVYPPGTGYARHVDQPRGRGQRAVSLVLYLNEEWDAGAGGELRIFDADDAYRDVEPIAGRLVCFLTAEREHAVLPAQRERLSVSGWFRLRE